MSQLDFESGASAGCAASASAIALKRIIKQRNDLLASAKKTGFLDTVMLELWTDSFIASAAAITARRFVFEARDYASQGQHNSLLAALKYAEFQYLYA